MSKQGSDPFVRAGSHGRPSSISPSAEKGSKLHTPLPLHFSLSRLLFSLPSPSSLSPHAGTCTVNNMIPNIFVTDRVYNSYNDRTRKFYCARGCNPLKPAGQTISYPSTLLGRNIPTFSQVVIVIGYTL